MRGSSAPPAVVVTFDFPQGGMEMQGFADSPAGTTQNRDNLLKQLLDTYSIAHYQGQDLSVVNMGNLPALTPATGGAVHILMGPPESGKTTVAIHFSLSEACRGRYVWYAGFDWDQKYFIKLARQYYPEPQVFPEKLMFDSKPDLQRMREVAAILPEGSIMVIDYLQTYPMEDSALPKTYNPGIEGRVSFLADVIQNLARQYKKRFLVISSQNRASLRAKLDGKNNGTDITGGLGSGRIEYSADSLMVLQQGIESVSFAEWRKRFPLEPAEQFHDLSLSGVTIATAKNRWSGGTTPEYKYLLTKITPPCQPEP